jgi:hypothetical protein
MMESTLSTVLVGLRSTTDGAADGKVTIPLPGLAAASDLAGVNGVEGVSGAVAVAAPPC